MGDASELDAVSWRVRELLSEQDGVIARFQVLDAGLPSSFVRRCTRAGRWNAVFPGVYITHNGPMTWRQRAWCAILAAAPAALSHESAIRVWVGDVDRRGDEPIHIAVSADRHVSIGANVIVHRRTAFDADVQTNLSPPRIRIEEAALDAAAAAPHEIDVIAVLSSVVGGRRTTADRLLLAASRRSRLRRRALIVAVLADIRNGTCSALEHEFLTRVERPHGLPTPIRQSPTRTQRRGLRDLEYPELGIAVELDGREFHDGAHARDRDMERDLDAAIESDLATTRLGWGQAAVRPCATAVKLGILFGKHGWAGKPTPCSSPECEARRS